MATMEVVRLSRPVHVTNIEVRSMIKYRQSLAKKAKAAAAAAAGAGGGGGGSRKASLQISRSSKSIYLWVFQLRRSVLDVKSEVL